MTDISHGAQRLGLLTSSVAHIVYGGSARAWESLRAQLWAATAEDFDQQVGGAREFGHDNEDKGASMFWERHPEVKSISAGGFFLMETDGPLKGWVGSSPDRRIMVGRKMFGLEIPYTGGDDVQAWTEETPASMPARDALYWLEEMVSGQPLR